MSSPPTPPSMGHCPMAAARLTSPGSCSNPARQGSSGGSRVGHRWRRPNARGSARGSLRPASMGEASPALSSGRKVWFVPWSWASSSRYCHLRVTNMCSRSRGAAAHPTGPHLTPWACGSVAAIRQFALRMQLVDVTAHWHNF